MDPMIKAFVVAAFICAGVIAGIITRALQSGTDYIDKDGEVVTLAALGNRVATVMCYSTLAAMSGWLGSAIAMVILFGTPDYAFATAFCTLVATMIGFGLAASSGYDLTVIDVEDEHEPAVATPAPAADAAAPAEPVAAAAGDTKV
jgi:hypothetical protein